LSSDWNDGKKSIVKKLSITVILMIFLAMPASVLAARDKYSKAQAAPKTEAAEKVDEPDFPRVVPGTLPLNLKVIAVEPALDGDSARFDLAKTPPMCLGRLSVLVDAAGGTKLIREYASSASGLNVSFKSYVGNDMTFHCVGNDGSGVPDSHLSNLDFTMNAGSPDDLLDVLHRVGAALYGWKVTEIDRAFTKCNDRARRNLEKDAFGVLPEYGSVKGMSCYPKSNKIILFAPDAD
jgi:hypothetical protein